MTFDQYLAAFALRRVLSSDLPEVGVQAITEGYDSVDLAALAGSSSRYSSPRDLEDLFRLGLRHLNKAIPGRAEAARILRDYYATMVATGAMSPRAGAAEIVALDRDVHDVLPPNKYVGDGLGVGRIYGLFYSHDDVRDDDERAHRQIDAEIKEVCRKLVDPDPT